MLRRITFSSLLALWLASAHAGAQSAIWPEQFGQFARKSAKPVSLTELAVWDEYGFQQAEEAQYASPGARFAATAYRLKDSTGSLAAFQWQRPAGSQPSKLGALAAETEDGVLLAYGNYLLRFQGYKPNVAELEALFNRLPRLDQSPVPTLPRYLPSQGLIPNSERFVVGPESLEKFAPGIPPSVAAFHVGAEAQLGRFQTKQGEMRLVIFSYPTPQIARQQAAAFEKLPGAMAKRAGPLLGVILSPPDPDAAERVLASVRYEASVTLSQYVPSARDRWENLLLNILLLTGILLLFCAVAGLAVGGLRTLVRHRDTGDPMIMLHLEDR